MWLAEAAFAVRMQQKSWSRLRFFVASVQSGKGITPFNFQFDQAAVGMAIAGESVFLQKGEVYTSIRLHATIVILGASKTKSE